MNQGTKLVLLMKKNRSQKSRASVPLKACIVTDDRLEKSELTFSQGMMKKGDVIDNADDYDDVRTRALQNTVY
jgi:hypothetical protein